MKRGISRKGEKKPWSGHSQTRHSEWHIIIHYSRFGATSIRERVIYPFIPVGAPSGNMFNTPLGQIAVASEQAKLLHHVWEPSRTVGMISGLQQNSLFSINKFADANYIIIFMTGKVKIFYGNKKQSPAQTSQYSKCGKLYPITTPQN